MKQVAARIKFWCATHLPMLLCLAIGWAIALWWQRRSFDEVANMRDSRFGIFLIAWTALLRFYIFSLLAAMVLIAWWYMSKLVILDQNANVDDIKMWQDLYDVAIGFIINKHFYYAVLLAFLISLGFTAVASAAVFGMLGRNKAGLRAGTKNTNDNADTGSQTGKEIQDEVIRKKGAAGMAFVDLILTVNAAILITALMTRQVS